MRSYKKKLYSSILNKIHHNFVLISQDKQVYANLVRMANLITAKYGYSHVDAYDIANNISYELLSFKLAKKVASYSDEHLLQIADNYFKYRH